MSKTFSNFQEFRDIVSLGNARDIPDVISFDVFDTVVYRAYAFQENNWKRISRYFYLRRLIAEKCARHLHWRIRSREVNLNEIYRFMPNSKTFSEELGLEREFIRIDPIIEEIIIELQRINKRILFITDTYYSSDEIRSIIAKARFEISSIEIFSSADFKTSKSEGLFEKVIQHHEINKADWIHIGDNFTSDFQSAKRFGISSLIYQNALSNFASIKVFSERGIKKILNIESGSLFVRMSETYERLPNPRKKCLQIVLSVILIKPIVEATIKLISDQQLDKSTNLILYCSRDGWLFYNLHKYASPPKLKKYEIEYLKTSRKLRNNSKYRNYLEAVIKSHNEIAVFDVGWKGSTLEYCESNFPEKAWKGIFFTSFYKGKSPCHNIANYDLIQKIQLFRSREFVELLFPAPTSSYTDISEDGTPLAEKTLSKEELERAKLIESVVFSEGEMFNGKISDLFQVLLILSRHPGFGIIDSLREVDFSSNGEQFVPLITDSWKKLFSRNKILWPHSANIDSGVGISILFKILCVIKEILQKMPILRSSFFI